MDNFWPGREFRGGLLGPVPLLPSVTHSLFLANDISFKFEEVIPVASVPSSFMYKFPLTVPFPKLLRFRKLCTVSPRHRVGDLIVAVDEKAGKIAALNTVYLRDAALHDAGGGVESTVKVCKCK